MMAGWMKGGWVDGRIAGWMKGGWADGWTDSWMDDGEWRDEGWVDE